MKIRDLHFFSKGLAKPIYRLLVGDKIQLHNGGASITKINRSATGNMKVFYRKDKPHALQPSWTVFKADYVKEFIFVPWSNRSP